MCRKSLRAKQRRLSCNGKPQPTHSSEIPCNTARRVNSTNRVYENDIQEMKTMLEQLWEANNSVLEKLAAID